jgi:hypothetical protein
MKSTALKLLTLLALALPAFAADTHEHGKKEPGPNGGRILTGVEPHLEFLVTKDRKVEITALTENLKADKLGTQVIAVTAGERSKPTKLEFKEEGGRLVSTNTLPDGNDFPVSVSIKAAAGAKPTYEKFNLNMDKCPTCKYSEYNCICAHTHGDEDDAKKK